MVFPSIPDYLHPNSNFQQYQQQFVEQNESILEHGNSININSNPAPAPAPAPTARRGSMTELAQIWNIPRPTNGMTCPRCGSTNTKFCYYNNRCFSQPRHKCRTCLRHWTHEGALRTTPIRGTRLPRRATPVAPPVPSLLGFDELEQLIGLNGFDEIGHHEFGHLF